MRTRYDARFVCYAQIAYTLADFFPAEKRKLAKEDGENSFLLCRKRRKFAARREPCETTTKGKEKRTQGWIRVLHARSPFEGGEKRDFCSKIMTRNSGKRVSLSCLWSADCKGCHVTRKKKEIFPAKNFSCRWAWSGLPGSLKEMSRKIAFPTLEAGEFHPEWKKSHFWCFYGSLGTLSSSFYMHKGWRGKINPEWGNIGHMWKETEEMNAFVCVWKSWVILNTFEIETLLPTLISSLFVIGQGNEEKLLLFAAMDVAKDFWGGRWE